LPHLKKEGGGYFVTFRLAGTLPANVLQKFKQEREQILQHALAAKRPLTWQEQEELFRWYSARVDAYLDAGHGDCFLRKPEIAKLVADALKFFDGQRYELRAWVVMPNHVHVVVWPRPPETLSGVLHSWKSFTAKEANKVLGRAGEFWQGSPVRETGRVAMEQGVSAKNVGQASSLPVLRASLPAVFGMMKEMKSTRGWKPLEPAGRDACPTSLDGILGEIKGRMFAA